jgi:hypothetical protein
MKTFKQYFLQESPAVGADGSRVDQRYLNRKGEFHQSRYAKDSGEAAHTARVGLSKISPDMDAEEVKQRVAAILNNLEQQYSAGGGESSPGKEKLMASMRTARRNLPTTVADSVNLIDRLCQLIEG